MAYTKCGMLSLKLTKLHKMGFVARVDSYFDVDTMQHGTTVSIETNSGSLIDVAQLYDTCPVELYGKLVEWLDHMIEQLDYWK